MAISGRPSGLYEIPGQLERNIGGDPDLVTGDPDCVTSCRAAVHSFLPDSGGRSYRLIQAIGENGARMAER